MINANEEQEVTQEEETYEDGNDTEETVDEPEESESDVSDEETVTLNKSEYEKLKRGLARKARLEGKEGSKESSKKDSGESTQSYDQDLIARTFLAAQAGVTDPDVQDEALRLAKKFDMRIDEAIRDADISARLKNLTKQKEAKAGIAGNGGNAVAKARSIDYYVTQFKRTNELPDDPRLVSKILDELAKKK